MPDSALLIWYWSVWIWIWYNGLSLYMNNVNLLWKPAEQFGVNGGIELDYLISLQALWFSTWNCFLLQVTLGYWRWPWKPFPSYNMVDSFALLFLISLSFLIRYSTFWFFVLFSVYCVYRFQVSHFLWMCIGLCLQWIHTWIPYEVICVPLHVPEARAQKCERELFASLFLPFLLFSMFCPHLFLVQNGEVIC